VRRPPTPYPLGVTRIRPAIVILAGLLPVFEVLSACGVREAGQGGVSTAPVTIRIVNRNWADMRVYLQRNGARGLLGVVTSGATADFTAPPDLDTPGATLRLVADPIGSTVAFASEPFQVAPGQTVEWTIRTRPAQSGVTVHR
jgi:hypothetical protein